MSRLDAFLNWLLGPRWWVVYSNYHPREIISLHFFESQARRVAEDNPDDPDGMYRAEQILR